MNHIVGQGIEEPSNKFAKQISTQVILAELSGLGFRDQLKLKIRTPTGQHDQAINSCLTKLSDRAASRQSEAQSRRGSLRR